MSIYKIEEVNGTGPINPLDSTCWTISHLEVEHINYTQK